jgi:hypothetical protein
MCTARLVTREGYLPPEFTAQAEARVRGIYALAATATPDTYPTSHRDAASMPGVGDPNPEAQ